MRYRRYDSFRTDLFWENSTMAAMHSEFAHDMESVAVRRCLDQLLASVRSDYRGMVSELRGEWAGDTLHIFFRAYGFPIEAHVHVGNHSLEWDGYVPTNVSFVREKVQKTIEARLTEMLRRGSNQRAA